MYLPFLGFASLLAFEVVRQAPTFVTASGKTAEVQVVTAQQGDTTESVVAEGSVMPGNVVNVTLQPDFGGMAIKVPVEVGQKVHKGEILAELSPELETNKLAEAASGVDYMRSQYKLALHPHFPEEIQKARLQIDADEQLVKEARAKLALLVAGNRPEQIDQARTEVQIAQTRYDSAKQNANRMKSLYDQELIPRATLEQANADLDVADNMLTQKKDGLKILQLGARNEEVEAQRATLEHAKVGLQRDERELEVMLQGSHPEQVEMNAAALAQAQAKLSQEHMALEHRFVRAPADGVIIERNINPGEFAIPESARSNALAPITNNLKSLFLIADNSSVEFLADVDQAYFSKVTVGQQVKVGVEAFPGKQFTGKVIRYQPAISPTQGNYNAVTGKAATPLTFPVWIRVQNPDAQLVAGQTGLATMAHPMHGLLIPQAAVNVFTLGEGTVFVVRNGCVRSRSVRFDASSGGKVKILSGLKDGDEVVVSDWTRLTDGAPVRVKEVTANSLTEKAM